MCGEGRDVCLSCVYPCISREAEICMSIVLDVFCVYFQIGQRDN